MSNIFSFVCAFTWIEITTKKSQVAAPQLKGMLEPHFIGSGVDDAVSG